jgi:glycosyltransferase involved in cell wall biosynthesis
MKLRKRTEELGLQGRVRFLGLVDYKTMPLLNRAADVAVLPSKAEGLANVWIEALCCGTPLVTTDVCGAREVMDRPEAGQIVADEPLEFARAIKELLSALPAPERVARSAERFTWSRSTLELQQHLRESAQRLRSEQVSGA